MSVAHATGGGWSVRAATAAGLSPCPAPPVSLARPTVPLLVARSDAQDCTGTSCGCDGSCPCDDDCGCDASCGCDGWFFGEISCACDHEADGATNCDCDDSCSCDDSCECDGQSCVDTSCDTNCNSCPGVTCARGEYGAAELVTRGPCAVSGPPNTSPHARTPCTVLNSHVPAPQAPYRSATALAQLRVSAPLAPTSRLSRPIRASQRQAHAHLCATPSSIAPSPELGAWRARPVPRQVSTWFPTARRAAMPTTASVRCNPRLRRHPRRRRVAGERWGCPSASKSPRAQSQGQTRVRAAPTSAHLRTASRLARSCL